MKPRDVLLTVLVAAVWGVHFVVIHVGLAHMPPVLFTGLRFGLAAVPAIFLVRRPTVAWRWVLGVALFLGVIKFSLVFVSMHVGMPAGLASVLLQSQAVFTTVFAVVLLRERPGRHQLIGLGIAALGVAVVGLRVGESFTPLAFVLLITGAAAWGVSNVLTRRAAPGDALSFIVWVSALATLPLLGLSLLFEGPAADLAALRGMGWPEVGALVYGAGLSTLFGFGVWGMLMRRYSAATVAPFSMLVPFFGVASGALFLHERLTPTDLVGAVLVIGGVLLPSLRRRPAPPAQIPAPAPLAEAAA